MSGLNLQARLEKIRAVLDGKNLHEIRQVGRYVGVHRPTDMKKDRLINYILDLAQNKIAPVPLSKRGAPPKSKKYDADIVNEVKFCRALSSGEQVEMEKQIFAVCSNEGENKGYKGILVKLNGGYFFKTIIEKNVCHVAFSNDLVNEFKMCEGDVLTCVLDLNKNKTALEVSSVISINDDRPQLRCEREKFDDLPVYYCNEKYEINSGSNDNTLRLIDFFTPLGVGQRTIIAAPEQTGKTTLLKKMATAILKCNRDVKIYALLIGGRPEDIADFKRTVTGVETVSSSFDASGAENAFLVEYTLERAKRLVEMGKEVVILCDGLNNLIQSHNAFINVTKSAMGEINVDALMDAKKFFASARKVEKGALTIVATVTTQTGDPIDDYVYRQFTAVSNAHITLALRYLDGEFFPVIDFANSEMRMDNALFTASQMRAVNKVKEAINDKITCEEIYSLINDCKNNEEFCKKLIERLK